jgi:outer membrane protein OmpA-like peptidoglycan-associated protein
MDNQYSWRDARGDDTYRLPGPDHLGWWAAAAMLVSVLLHVVVFISLDRLKVGLRFQQARELTTGPVDVRQVQVTPAEPETRATPENLVVPPADPASLLEEIDLLQMLPTDIDIDISPEILEPEYALRMENPALAGDPESIAMELATGLDIEADLPDLGREMTELQPAAIGQLTIDPGAAMADDPDLTRFTDDLLKQGAAGRTDRGALDGLASIDELIGLPPNTLVGKTTMLPSDLLFEFNSATLRESAKIGLMKLGLLIDHNPDLYCWIEGHTDLIGGDAFNLDLSRRRAAAVKTYLVESMRMDENKIITRGYGRTRPIVPEGDADEQAPNRRVEIRMRRTPPTDDAPATPPAAQRPVVADDEPPPPRAVRVTPQRELPEDEYLVEPPPRAQPVPELEEEEPPPPRAIPVEPPLRAIPVEIQPDQ